MPDYEKYKGELYLKYKRDLPGEIVFDSENLLATLRRAVSSNKETLDEFKKREMEMCDGKATQRVLDLISSYLK